MLQLDECGELDVSGEGGRGGTQISALFELTDDGGASDGLGYGVWPPLGMTTTRSQEVRRLASFDGSMIMDGAMSPQDLIMQRQQLQINTPKPPTATRRPQLRGARSMSSIQMSPFQMGKELGINSSTNATGYFPPVAGARRTSAANLVDDHHGHARTRLESWSGPARAAARIPALGGSVQMPAVPQILDHYKGLGLQDGRGEEGNGSKGAAEAREAAATVVAAAARIADEEERKGDGERVENDISETRGKFADISSAPGISPEMENSSTLNPSTRTTSASPIAGDNNTSTPSSCLSASSSSFSSSSSLQLRLLQNTRHGLGLDQNTCSDLERKAIGVSGPGQRPRLLQEPKYERHPCDAPAAPASSGVSGLADTVSSSSNSSPSTSIAPGCGAAGGSSNTTLNTHILHPASSDIQNLYDSTTGPPHQSTQPQTIGHSSSFSLVQRRLLRRQKSRDLSTVRKTLSTDALRSRRMMDRPRADVVLEDFPGETPDYMDYLPSPSSQEHQQYMISTPLSLSSESLHQQYTFPQHQQQQQQPDLQQTPHLTPSTHANSEWQTTYPAAQNWWDSSTTRAAEAEGYNIYDSPFYPQHHHHHQNIKSPIVPSPPASPGFTFSALATPDLSFSTFDTPYHYTHTPQTPPSRPPSQGRQQHHQQAAKKPARTARRKQSCASIRDEAAGSAFVNFTPKDASKILSGVAPSGSSKTKARREREAAERRRKLSEIAHAAVRAVGGDVGALEGVELL